MTDQYRSIKGTKDILPDEAEVWQTVEGVVRDVMRAFGYREIRTPLFEATRLFARSIGELTDIVGKEMYTFTDRSGESLTLKPEGTASVLRAYVQHHLGRQSPLTKLYYVSPMFRQERPQAGRLRQFHQFGAEALGSSSPALDVEAMILPLEIARRLGVSRLSLRINSVGCEKCRPAYRALIVRELQAVADQLSEESRSRLSQNPLRVLDSKDDRDRRLTAHLPSMTEHLCENCRTHFEEVRQILAECGQPFQLDHRMVRGLDYYTKTAFEITSTALGAQNAVAGGGRYDLLVQELGGDPTPGVGFAAGIERLMLILAEQRQSTATDRRPDLFIVAPDDRSRRWAFTTALRLRSSGRSVELDYLSRSVKAQMREANRLGVRYVLVAGETELSSGSATLKNMETGEETRVHLDRLDAALG